MSFRSAADLDGVDVASWLQARTRLGCPKARLDLEAELAFATDKSPDSPDLGLESCRRISDVVDVAVKKGLVYEGPDKTVVAADLNWGDGGLERPKLPNARLQSVERHGMSFAMKSFGSEFEPGGAFGPGVMDALPEKKAEFVRSVKEHWRVRGFLTRSQGSVLASILYSSYGQYAGIDGESGSWREIMSDSVGRVDPRLIGLGAREAAAAAEGRRAELRAGWAAEKAFEKAEVEAAAARRIRREKAESRAEERRAAKERALRRAALDLRIQEASAASAPPVRPAPGGKSDRDLSKVLEELHGSEGIGRLREAQIAAAIGSPAGMERYLAASGVVFDGRAEDPTGAAFASAAQGKENPHLMLVLAAALYGEPPDRVWGCSEAKKGSRWAERLRDVFAVLEGSPPAPLSGKGVRGEDRLAADSVLAKLAVLRRPDTAKSYPLSNAILAERNFNERSLACALSLARLGVAMDVSSKLAGLKSQEAHVPAPKAPVLD